MYIADINLENEFETNTSPTYYPQITLFTPVIYHKLLGNRCSLELLDSTSLTWSDTDIAAFNASTGSKFQAYAVLYDLECKDSENDCGSSSIITCNLQSVSGVDGYPGVCELVTNTKILKPKDMGWRMNTMEK
jgi:hypothetical protein